MFKLFQSRKGKGRAQVRGVMAQLWAQLRQLERSGKVADKLLFVVEDGALGRAIEKKAGPRIGVLLLREQGRATDAAVKFAEAALQGFRIVLVLRTHNYRGWALLVRSLLRNHVAIISSEPFEVKTSTEEWINAPEPFTGWFYLPPNSFELRYPTRDDVDTERKLLDILEDWDGEPGEFLPVPF